MDIIPAIVDLVSDSDFPFNSGRRVLEEISRFSNSASLIFKYTDIDFSLIS